METPVRSRRRTPTLRSLQDEVSRLFDSMFPTMDEEEQPRSAVWSPRIDLMEADGSYRLHMDLPGVQQDDVSITFDDNRLTIRGERSDEMREKSDDFIRMERMFGTFYRSVRLPKAVAEDKIKATFKDGVLSVDIPKTEKRKPKQIKIS